jgi:hypothetical protein
MRAMFIALLLSCLRQSFVQSIDESFFSQALYRSKVQIAPDVDPGELWRNSIAYL